MKKTLIISAIAFSALSFAFAKDSVTASTTLTAKGKPAIAAKAEVKAEVKLKKDLASTTDALGIQIKSLNMEMETKIKAIRDDYQARIKALIASTTPMMKKDDKQASSSDKRASSTDDRARGQVKGVEIENTAEVSGNSFMHFFRGLFGNN